MRLRERAERVAETAVGITGGFILAIGIIGIATVLVLYGRNVSKETRRKALKEASK